MECAIKAGLCRRFSRRVNMIARKNPVKAPRKASVIERLLKVRSPLAGQKESGIRHSCRPENYANRVHGYHHFMSKYCHNWPLPG